MFQRPGIALTALVLLASLAACGGGEEPTAARVSTLSAQHAEIVLAPMLGDDGSIMPSDPGAAPADYGARTRAGHYASPLQAEQLEHALGHGVLRVDVACCGHEAAELAVLIAFGLQAAHDLDKSAPVLVYGRDLRVAASIANWLNDEGYSRVWLVTQ